MPVATEFDPMALYDFGAENIDPNMTYCIEAQEIFEIGTHKGKPYTGNDTKTIAENFKRFYFTDPVPLLMPPAVIGHEEDQEILKRSDLPAAGWVKACFLFKGTKLAVNISEIPGLVMYWIKKGLIRTVSAEIYDDSGDAGLPAGFGPTLRRVAFLGGDIPQVKTLSRLKIPVPEKHANQFSESRVQVYTMPIHSENMVYFAEGPRVMGKDASGHEHGKDGKFTRSGTSGRAPNHEVAAHMKKLGLKARIQKPRDEYSSEKVHVGHSQGDVTNKLKDHGWATDKVTNGGTIFMRKGDYKAELYPHKSGTYVSIHHAPASEREPEALRVEPAQRLSPEDKKVHDVKTDAAGDQAARMAKHYGVSPDAFKQFRKDGIGLEKGRDGKLSINRSVRGGSGYGIEAMQSIGWKKTADHANAVTLEKNGISMTVNKKDEKGGEHSGNHLVVIHGTAAQHSEGPAMTQEPEKFAVATARLKKATPKRKFKPMPRNTGFNSCNGSARAAALKRWAKKHSEMTDEEAEAYAEKFAEEFGEDILRAFSDDDQLATNSEGRPMKYPKLFDDMKKEGIDDDVASKAADMEPEMLRKMSACMKKFADQMAPPTEGDPAADNEPAFDRVAAIELIASKNGIDRATLETKTDDELKALMGPASMSDSEEDPTPVTVNDSQTADERIEDTTGGSSGQASAIAQKHSEKRAAARKHSEGATVTDNYVLKSRVARLEEQLNEQKRRERLAALKNKQAKVNKFCEDAVKEGRVTPAELSAGLKDLLLGSDDETVRKFSDGSSATELQKQFDLIMKRPKLHIFSEKMPTASDNSAAEDAYIRKLKESTGLGRKALAREAASAGKQ